MVQTFCLIAGMALLWPVPAMAQQAGFFNVRDHGAAGDGLNDDTQAIRAAISEAGAYVAANPGQIATIYLPEGTYNVCPQDGEPVWQAAVFKIESGNLHFLGDGPDLSVISFHHFGMTDPSTNWKTTDGGYFKIFRANGFSFSMVNSVQNLTFEGLRLTGNAEATGNADVGGAFRDIIHHSGRLYSVNADGMWSSGTAVEFSGFSQTLPPELSADKTYYIINNDPVRPSLFQLAETVDGPALVLTDTGTHFRVRKAGGSSEANIICSGDKLVHLGRSLTKTSGIGWDNGVRIKLAPAYASLPPEVDRHAYFYITERAGYTFKVSTEPGGQSFAMSEGSDGRYFRMLNGDGWDMLHKAVSMNTGDWDNIVVDNCRFDRWRGEIIHGGGEAPGTLTIRNSILEHSNGSAASIPSLVMEDSTVRYVYNGVENYARMPWQKMEIRRCTFIASEGRIYGEMNGIVPLRSRSCHY
jgi:hypothetical protein